MQAFADLSIGELVDLASSARTVEAAAFFHVCLHYRRSRAAFSVHSLLLALGQTHTARSPLRATFAASRRASKVRLQNAEAVCTRKVLGLLSSWA